MACAVPDRRCVCGRPGGRTSLRAPAHAGPSREALSPGAGATPATLWPLGLCVRDSAAFWVCRPRGAGEMDVAWRGLGGRRPGRSCVSARRPCVLRRGSWAPWWRQEPSVPRHEQSCQLTTQSRRPHTSTAVPARLCPLQTTAARPRPGAACTTRSAAAVLAAGSWPLPGRGVLAARGLRCPPAASCGRQRGRSAGPAPSVSGGFRHTARLSDAWPGG